MRRQYVGWLTAALIGTTTLPNGAAAFSPVIDEMHRPLLAITASGEIYIKGHKLPDEPAAWEELQILLKGGGDDSGRGVICIEARTSMTDATRNRLFKDFTLPYPIITLVSPGCVRDYVSVDAGQ